MIEFISCWLRGCRGGSIAFSTGNHLSLDKLGEKRERKTGGQWSGERERYILLCVIMNALSGRIHQWSPGGGKRQEKLWFVGCLTHVVCYSKVIQEQKLSCCCTSSICKAVRQNREKYGACDTMHNKFRPF